MTAIGSNLPSLLSYTTGSGYASGGTPTTLAQILSEVSTATSQTSTTVTLSDQAKAYLAGLVDSANSEEAPAATLAANARTWFDQ
ncbi:MAG: hypothetical protein ACRECC_09755 [Pseudolabrys sp.]